MLLKVSSFRGACALPRYSMNLPGVKPEHLGGDGK